MRRDGNSSLAVYLQYSNSLSKFTDTSARSIVLIGIKYNRNVQYYYNYPHIYIPSKDQNVPGIYLNKK